MKSQEPQWQQQEVYICQNKIPIHIVRGKLSPSTKRSSCGSELSGVFNGLEKLTKHKGVVSIRVILDNQAVVKHLKILEETVAQSLSDGRVGHSLWIEVHQMIRWMEERGIKIEFQHIMGHPERGKEEYEFTRDERGNQMSDLIASLDNSFQGIIEVEEVDDQLKDVRWWSKYQDTHKKGV